MSNNFEQNAASLANRFASLSAHAELLAFPDYRKGIFQPQDLAGHKSISKFIYNISHPFSTIETLSFLFYIAWAILYFLEFMAMALGAIYLYSGKFNLPQLFPPSDTPTIIFVLLSFLLVALPVSIISYAWGWETLRAQKIPWWVKVGLLISVFWILNSITINPLGGSIQLLWDWDIIKSEPLIAGIVFCAFLIPASMYMVAILFDIIVLVLFVIRTLFGGIASVHAPRPIEIILKLAIEEIPATKPDIAAWKLSQLGKDEIYTLRQWAEANREGSEKRTLPASIIATLVGVSLTSEIVRGALDKILSGLIASIMNLLQAKSPFVIPVNMSLSALILFPLILVLVLTFAQQLIALFRNVVAQNIIIEACIITEYALQSAPNDSKKLSIWDLIMSFLKPVKF
jgi:hypothetical protein